MKNKDIRLIWEALIEATITNPGFGYPAHWPASIRQQDQLDARKEIETMFKPKNLMDFLNHGDRGKEDPDKFYPMNPKTGMPYEGFWVGDDYFETEGDPSEPDGTYFKIERLGEWPNWKLTKVSTFPGEIRDEDEKAA